MKYFYNLFGFFLSTIVFTTSYGQQNLVLNPSFEDVNLPELSCGFYGTPGGFENAMQDWTVPSTGSSDIFHMSLDTNCMVHPLSTFFINVGNQLPRTGDSMCGLIISSVGNSYREYLQGKLSEPLEVGKKYIIEFYVSFADRALFATNNFGIKFLTDPYFQNSWLPINMVPDANFNEVIVDTQSWVLVSLEFTPQVPDLNDFIIGNFFSDDDTTVEEIGGDDFFVTESYYFIDDVSIMKDTSVPIFEQPDAYCKGASFTLPSVSENGHTGTWSPEINNQETTTYTFTPDNPDIEETTITVEIIEPYIEPTFNIVESVCKGTVFVLPNESENGYLGTWSPEVNNQKTTTYTFTPEDGHCVLPASVTVQIIEPTVPAFTINSFSCIGIDLDLPLESENGIPGTWSPKVNNQETTTYKFTPHKDYCAKSISVTVEIKVPNNLILEQYCAKGNLYVEAMLQNISSFSNFQWKINQVLVDEDSHLLNISENAILLDSNKNTIELNVTDESGCLLTSTIDIMDLGNLCFIPKGVSPNNDGLNDYFNLESFGGVSLQIFNRYGTKVYEKNNYLNEWKGNSNAGKPLPSGTYFYHIQTYRGAMHTGWVELIHEN